MAKTLEDAFLGVETEVYGPSIHNFIRYISRKGEDTADGQRSVWTVDAELEQWIQKGFKLFNTHFLGENPEGFGVLYILVRG